MQRSFGIQISDLEPIQSSVEQELTLEEAEKIVGGTKDKHKEKENDLPIVPPIDPTLPCSLTV